VYEKCLAHDFTAYLDSHLESSQGGFRPHRSTLDQIAILREVVAQNKEFSLLFLDIKAAYDCVDRRVLWSALANNFRLPLRTITLLRSLFDSNRCYLEIGSFHSDLITNTRGLFQGSSLSPLLFNVVINSLAVDLHKHLSTTGLPASLSGLLRFNHLLYADDLVLVAKNPQEGQRLLSVCETWALSHGFLFAPKKCAIVSTYSKAPDTLLYGEIVKVVPTYKYLGVTFSSAGIDWQATIMPRVHAAYSSANWMKSQGFHAFGWRTDMSLKVYKLYLRPMFEYGIALGLPKLYINKLQVAQNTILRLLLSTPSNTAIDSIHLFLGLEKIWFRVQVLHTKLYNSIFNGPKRLMPIGLLLAELAQLPEASIRGRLSYTFRRAGLLRDIVIHEHRVPTPAEFNGARIDHLRSVHSNSTTLAAQDMIISAYGSMDTIATRGSYLPRNYTYVLAQWKLGQFRPCRDPDNYAATPLCKLCRDPNSRSHMLSCAPNILASLQQVIHECRDTIPLHHLPPLGASPIICVATLLHRLSPTSPPQTALLGKLAVLLVQAKLATDALWTEPIEDRYHDDDDPTELLNKLLAVQRRQLHQPTSRSVVSAARRPP
jgi:hypothetical protein